MLTWKYDTDNQPHYKSDAHTNSAVPQKGQFVQGQAVIFRRGTGSPKQQKKCGKKGIALSQVDDSVSH